VRPYCASRFLLDVDGATGALNGAAKLDQYSVVGALNDPAPMLRDRQFQEFAAMRVEADRRTLLLPSAGDTDNICCKDGGKTPLSALFRHSEHRFTPRVSGRVFRVYYLRPMPICGIVDPIAHGQQGRKPGSASGTEVDDALAAAERSARKIDLTSY
jgi:hypothetical protein